MAGCTVPPMRLGTMSNAINAGTIGEVIDEAHRAADLGCSTFWAPQIFGQDALTTLAVVGREVPGIELGTAVAMAFPLWNVAVNETTNRVYALSPAPVVAVIDGATNAVHVLPVGPSPGSIAINEVTNRIYVTHWPANSVSVINGDTEAIAVVATQSGPYGPAVNPVTNRIYVPNQNSDSVTASAATKAWVESPPETRSNMTCPFRTLVAQSIPQEKQNW